MPNRNIANTTPTAVFVQIMREERERRGLMADQLAESIGLHRHVINDWEQGKRTPRLHSAVTWAKSLGFEIELVRR